jgi:acyl carrier protein
VPEDVRDAAQEDEEARLLEFIRTRLVRRKTARIRRDTLLFERRLLDSMNILDLIGYVERARGRRLGRQDLLMANFRDVRTIVRTFLDDSPGSAR